MGHSQPECPEPVWMSDGILASLREFIAALDRRVPRVGRTAETAIASDAATLRRAAVRQIRDIEGRRSASAPYDQALVGAIMTDDGGTEGA